MVDAIKTKQPTNQPNSRVQGWTKVSISYSDNRYA